MLLGKWPLAVHVVMHGYQPNPELRQSFDDTERFVDRLCERLSGGDRSPEVPVRLWRKVGERLSSLPKEIPLDWSSKNLVIIIVDQALFEARDDWGAYMSDLMARCANRRDVVIPISVHADAARLAWGFGDVNHLFVRDAVPLAEDERIFQALFTAMLRLLVTELPKVFLCHAKAKLGTENYGEGERIARDIRRYIYEETQLSCFFDLHDIPHGHPVKCTIESAISNSVILAVWTDRLLDSPWCQFELICARRQQRPMLVLDALASATPRLFPYLGNMPVVRWREDTAKVVTCILLELLRTYHLKSVFNTLSSTEKCPPSFGLHPPDLLETALSTTLPDDQKFGIDGTSSDILVYPDPPIKPNELEVIQAVVPSKRFLSLVEWRSLRAAGALQARWDIEREPRPNPLSGMQVGVSMSASDSWAEMGLLAQHQEGLASDIALDLILLGSKLIWGGDLRPEGLGAQLKRIVQTYQHPSHPPQTHVGMFVPFSPDAKRRLDVESLYARRLFADVKILKSPFIEYPDYSVPSDPKSDEAVALSAVALSMMRIEMAHACGARIILGGGLQTFAGIYPGIAEEALEAIRIKRPIYILGGFGGASRAVYEAVANSGSGAQQIREACHNGGAAARSGPLAAHKKLVLALKNSELNFDPTAMIHTFSRLTLKGLSDLNGLTQSENARLSVSQNIIEIIELLVKGLCWVKSSRDRYSDP